jgi:hypothetical protein
VEDGHFLSTVGSKFPSWPEKVVAKRLVGLTTLGRRRSCCGVNWAERTILGFSRMSSHRLHASFVKFGGEMKY